LAADSDSKTETVIDALLKAPAPPPDWREHLDKRKQTPPPKPPAEAPIEELKNYWRTAPETEAPDDATRARLLEACEAVPDEISELLPRLKLDSPEVQDRLKKLYDRLVAERRREDASKAEMIRDALMMHSKYFREELIRRVFFPDDIGEAAFVEATSALIRLDRDAAKQLFLKESIGTDLMHRVWSLSNLHEQFATEVEPEIAAGWLSELKRIAADPKSAREPRGFALKSVMSTKTEENNQWFLELFRDPTLDNVREYSDESTLLGNVVAIRPDYWIPKIASLVGNKNAAIHANAVHALIYFYRERTRADALRPLLPWLENPKWAPDPKEIRGRSCLIQSLYRVDLPESVPGLLKVVQADSEYDLAGAAEALAHYNAHEAIEPLKRSLKREKQERERWRITDALVKLGGLSVEEMVEALKLYAIKMSTADGRKELEAVTNFPAKKPLDSRVSMGKELARSELSDDRLSAELLAEAKQLSATNPAAADLLRQFVAQWQTPSALKAIVDRLRAGDFTAEWVKQLVEQRKRLAAPLTEVHDLTGAALGIQAALTADPTLVNRVLEKQDRLAQLALAAVARLARVELPITTIAILLTSQDQTLARAAELYLEANDSPEARAELLRRAPGAAKILGARWWFDPGHVTFGAFDETEKKLRDLVLKEKGPEAIYALLSEGYWGGDGQRALVVENGKTILHGDDGNGRTRECEVPAAEMKSLVEWLERERIEDLPPFDTGTADGIQWEFVRLNRDGGRRIFMNNPPYGAGAPRVEFGDARPGPDPAIYGELTRRFTTLTARPMQVVYRTLAALPGYQLVHPREKGEVVAIRKERDHLVVGIRLPSEGATAWHRVTESGLSSDFIVEKIKQDSNVERYGQDHVVEIHDGPLAGKRLVSKWKDDEGEDGLWAVQKERKPELIAKGIFGAPILCPGGEWIVCAKTFGANMWDLPNGVVRISLSTRRVFPVNLPPADNFDAMAWIVAHQRVLLYQQRDDPRLLPENAGDFAGPEKPEFYLLDPMNGEHTRVEGEFRPLQRLEGHALQPTGKPNEFWAVIVEKEDDLKRTAVLGRYDTQKFRFSEALRFAGMWFNSWDCFVDAATKQVWLAVNGDLLRLALPDDSTPSK
jgi:DNA-binding transcriptional ArsR family regulator